MQNNVIMKKNLCGEVSEGYQTLYICIFEIYKLCSDCLIVAGLLWCRSADANKVVMEYGWGMVSLLRHGSGTALFRWIVVSV